MVDKKQRIYFPLYSAYSSGYNRTLFSSKPAYVKKPRRWLIWGQKLCSVAFHRQPSTPENCVNP